MLIIYHMSSREYHLSNIHLNMAWLCAYCTFLQPLYYVVKKMWWTKEALYFIHLFLEERLQFHLIRINEYWWRFQETYQKLRLLRSHFQIIMITIIKTRRFLSFFCLGLAICKEGWHLFILACPRKRVSSHLQVMQLDALTEEVKPNWYDNNIIDRMWLLPAVSDSPSFAVCSLRCEHCHPRLFHCRWCGCDLVLPPTTDYCFVL